MVKRSKRKRSVKHYMKEYEYSQEFCSGANVELSSPPEIERNPLEPDLQEQKQNSVEIVESYSSKFEIEEKQTPKMKKMRSPLPHEIKRESEKEESEVLNIYN